MKGDRFDFENQLMSCWNIIEDIHMARQRFEFTDREDNYMLGLETIYQEKFSSLKETFEQMIEDGKIT